MLWKVLEMHRLCVWIEKVTLSDCCLVWRRGRTNSVTHGRQAWQHPCPFSLQGGRRFVLLDVHDVLLEQIGCVLIRRLTCFIDIGTLPCLHVWEGDACCTVLPLGRAGGGDTAEAREVVSSIASASWCSLTIL